MHSAQGIQNISLANTGRQMSDEFKENQRQRMLDNQHLLGHVHSAETRKKIGSSSEGRKPSLLCRQKARERAIERNKTNPPRKGKKNSLEHNRKVSEARTGIELSSSHKENLRLAALKRSRNSKGQFEGD